MGGGVAGVVAATGVGAVGFAFSGRGAIVGAAGTLAAGVMSKRIPSLRLSPLRIFFLEFRVVHQRSTEWLAVSDSI